VNKHTPGPWYYRPDGVTVEAQTKEGYDMLVADCGKSYVMSDGEMKSNARLIAVCPDMLSALERVSEWMKRNSNPEMQGIACEVFQVIDKAKGNP
jgi:hypothetical protein